MYQNLKITDASLHSHIGINVNCGEFSYAEIPFKFKHIFGLTGTLRTLSKIEINIIEEVYNIRKKTFIPSIYGENNLVFTEKSDVFIENEHDYHNRIMREIESRIKGKVQGTERAVIVFFESKKSLVDFYHSNAFANVKEFAKTLTEEDNLTLAEKDKFVKDVTRSGMISLITKSFGRGTDFVCRDDIVLGNLYFI